MDKLVDNIRTIFVSLYGEQVKKPHTTLVECHGFDDYFDQQLRELDKSSTADPAESIDVLDDSPDSNRLSAPGLTYRGRAVSNGGGQEPTSAGSTPNTSRPSTPASSNLVVAKAGPVAKMSRRARKAKHNSAPVSSGDESPRSKKGASAKKGRKWDADGFADEDDDVQLDYSAQDGDGVGKSSAVESVDSSTWGTSAKGKFVLRDLGDEVQGILASAEAEKAAASCAASAKSGMLSAGVNAISGLFRNVVGGETLTKEDLEKAMKGMEDHLLRKNVAREAAVRLCEGVEKELVGTKTGNFEGKLASPGCHKLLLLTIFDRYQCQDTDSHGGISHQDAHSDIISRPPPRHRLHYIATRHVSPPAPPLCHVDCRRQRSGQID